MKKEKLNRSILITDNMSKNAGWVVNSVDSDQTPRSGMSLCCLFKPVSPNIYDKY